MKFGFRTPSFKKRVSARTSWKRVLRHRVGIKVPRGAGFITNPKKALYNKIYNKTTFGLGDLVGGKSKTSEELHGKKLSIGKKRDGSIDCPRCGVNMGQPVTKGVFIKSKVYLCPECNLKAKIADE